MQQYGNKGLALKQEYYNGEASASIPPGAPLVFKMDGTDDGIKAVLPSSASALLAQNFFCGIAADGQSVATGGYGSAVILGFHSGAIVALQTRTASTESWSTAAALSVGQALSVDTTYNALLVGSTSPVGTVNAITNSTQGNTASIGVALPLNLLQGPGIVLAATHASAAGSASTSNDTRLAITYALKVQLRSL